MEMMRLDDLTGLPTLEYFKRHFNMERQKMKDDGIQTAFIYLNLRNMRGYNETHGYEAGNRLLEKVSNILRHYFQRALICRYIDDCFLLLGDCGNLADRIHHVYQDVGAAGAGIRINAGVYQLGDGEESFHSLCAHARLAANYIHNDENRCYSLYEEKMMGRTTLERHLAEHIDEAIAQHHIKVFYQPIIRTMTNSICAFEALARWIDPVYGMVTPRVFLSVLEDTN